MLKETLFFTFLGIFAATACVTLLGVAQKLKIQSKYLTVLFTALLIELAGAVIGLFKATDFFPKETAITPSLRDELVGSRWMFTDKQVFWPIVLLRDGKILVAGNGPLPEYNS